MNLIDSILQLCTVSAYFSGWFRVGEAKVGLGYSQITA